LFLRRIVGKREVRHCRFNVKFHLIFVASRTASSTVFSFAIIGPNRIWSKDFLNSTTHCGANVLMANHTVYRLGLGVLSLNFFDTASVSAQSGRNPERNLIYTPAFAMYK
jgi:hypothetical protein